LKNEISRVGDGERVAAKIEAAAISWPVSSLAVVGRRGR